MRALQQVEDWSADHVAVGVVTATRREFDAWHGPWDTRHFEWASVTKVATALVVLVAVEEGTVDLDEPAGPPGSTVRHLLAHASGLSPDPGPPVARPGTRRIYSTYGFDVLADFVAARAGMPFVRYFEQVLWSINCCVDLYGSPGAQSRGTLRDLMELASQLVGPTLVSRETMDEATAVAFPGLVGVLPGFGRMEPNDWGLGFEIRDAKSPHWTGTQNAPRTFGHFGRSGTFLWVEPDLGVALACLTDREFDAWALDAWPRLSDAVLDELSLSR